jgi:hypothetical protein
VLVLEIAFLGRGISDSRRSTTPRDHGLVELSWDTSRRTTRIQQISARPTQSILSFFALGVGRKTFSSLVHRIERF